MPRPSPARPLVVTVGDRAFPVDIARHPRARRYVLRVTAGGRLRLTVPRGASIASGLAFASREEPWILREWGRLEERATDWAAGTVIWYRGERVSLEVGRTTVSLAGRSIPLGHRSSGVRAAVERHLRDTAGEELSRRAVELARERGIVVARVTVRNQRSRWGSCSPRGAIALNWRLIQMPPDVSDYVILHELAHRRHGNHSTRFWREVERLCPFWRAAERWLRKHGKDLL